MSLFLQNLIDRNQINAVNAKASPIVQPRQRARFESSPASETLNHTDTEFTDNPTSAETDTPGTGSMMPHHEPKAVLAKSNSESTPHSHISEQTNVENTVTQPNQQLGEINERISALRLQVGNKTPAVNINDNSQAHQNHHPKQDINQQSVIQPFAVPTNLAIEGHKHVPSEHPDLKPQIIQSLETESKQNKDHQPEQNSTPQSGLLQEPDWLTKVQTDLNHRLQEIKATIEPDPVINVSIGCVEVKAVQSDTAKHTKSRKKPSGVMSLDDYLKQREIRGRA